LDQLLAAIYREILNPIIAFLFALALVLFIYGIVEFLWSGDNNEEKRTEGKKHLLWGVVGMFIMFSVYGILHLICNTINCI
jgi:hypothetical protein